VRLGFRCPYLSLLFRTREIAGLRPCEHLAQPSATDSRLLRRNHDSCGPSDGRPRVLCTDCSFASPRQRSQITSEGFVLVGRCFAGVLLGEEAELLVSVVAEQVVVFQYLRHDPAERVQFRL